MIFENILCSLLLGLHASMTDTTIAEGGRNPPKEKLIMCSCSVCIALCVGPSIPLLTTWLFSYCKACGQCMIKKVEFNAFIHNLLTESML